MNHFIRAGLVWLALLLSITGASAQNLNSAPTNAHANGAAATATAEPSLDDLIRILENDAARGKLVDSLKAAAYEAPPAQAATSADGGVETASVPADIARYSQFAIASVMAVAVRALDAAADARRILSGARGIDIPRVLDAILPVALVAAAVLLAYSAAHVVKRRIVGGLARRGRGAGLVGKLLLLIGVGIVDLVQILISAGIGYVAAIVFFGGPPNFNQALFLNAFVFTEIARAAFDMFVSPRFPELRATPFSDTQATFWYRWLSRIITLLGYTFLFLAPLVGGNSSRAAGDAVRLLAATAALAIVLFLIARKRVQVGRRLARRFDRGDRSVSARALALLGKVWWMVAAAFVLTLYGVWLNSPDAGLRYMAVASLQSVATMVTGGLVANLLARPIAEGVAVPAALKHRLPMLERRVNSFIPAALTVLRFAILAVVVAVIVEAWQVFDFGRWVETGLGQRVVGGAVGAAVVLCLGFVVFLGVSSFVEYRLNPNYGSVPTARERTLLALFRNGFTITLIVIVAMLVLSQIGIDIGPLLAGAGVVGLAIGFGAQKLVQDIITGAFIQLENAMNEGDVVRVGSTTGTVEHLTIRSVALRSVDGSYHLIPFSSVDQVSNLSKGFSRCVADIGVAYRENVEEVKGLMRQAFEQLKAGDQGSNIIGDFEMFGLQELGASQVTVRARMTTQPGKQWAVGRAYNEIVKRLFDANDVELPFPQTTVWFGEDKAGRAPPLRLSRREGTSPEPVATNGVATPGDRGAIGPRGTGAPPHDGDAREEDGAPQ